VSGDSVPGEMSPRSKGSVSDARESSFCLPRTVRSVVRLDDAGWRGAGEACSKEGGYERASARDLSPLHAVKGDGCLSDDRLGARVAADGTGLRKVASSSSFVRVAPNETARRASPVPGEGILNTEWE
jgi:hypothetical protein